MSFIKAILKYSGLLMLSGWMFFMGVLVGRNTSPVEFDTGWFQERLAVIFDDSKPEESVLEKPELDFYAALQKSDQTEDYDLKLRKTPVVKDGNATSTSPDSLSEAHPEDISTNDLDKPLKKSRKAMTSRLHGRDTPSATKTMTDTKNLAKGDASESISSYVSAKRFFSKNKIGSESNSSNAEQANVANRSIQTGSSDTSGNPRHATISARSDKTKSQDSQGQADEIKNNQGKEYSENTYSYTIQIASFPSETDAMTHIAKLGEKGYSAYKSSGMVGEKTWYRIRTGSFNNITEAKESLKKLEENGIKGLIIQKD
ncbi:MAG: SPOR domain-containing protein [Desulfamplus sp.]|nr:SPOR domain-containing protein [Desulfamplus sp.]